MADEIIPDAAARLNTEWRAIRASAERLIDNVLKLGAMIDAELERLQPHERRPWIEAHCEFSYATARNYVKLARQSSLTGVRPDYVRHLYPSGRSQPSLPTQSNGTSAQSNGTPDAENTGPNCEHRADAFAQLQSVATPVKLLNDIVMWTTPRPDPQTLARLYWANYDWDTLDALTHEAQEVAEWLAQFSDAMSKTSGELVCPKCGADWMCGHDDAAVPRG
ncbi:MAG: hypothetical protein M3N13_06525 [Candidatus Eremiobacteraeota bacterium]|nr:hypothetical protein [Candidatus Eremiobacteraeota bacterium]